MKKILLSILMLISLQPILAQEPPKSEPKNSLLLFADELGSFSDKANDLYENDAKLTAEEREKGVQDLMVIASRISNLYFENVTTELKPQMDAFLNQKNREHEKVRAYFKLLGNAFYDGATTLISDRDEQSKKYRKYSTIGGLLVGIAGGGALFLMSKAVSQSAGRSILAFVGLAAVGAGVGYFAGPYVETFFLPVDPRIQNAKDFIALYPSGEDFFEKVITDNEEIERGLSALEEKLNDL